MVTLESRAYGVARLIRQQVGDARGRPPWMIVNDVAGFIEFLSEGVGAAAEE